MRSFFSSTFISIILPFYFLGILQDLMPTELKILLSGERKTGLLSTENS